MRCSYCPSDVVIAVPKTESDYVELSSGVKYSKQSFHCSKCDKMFHAQWEKEV